MLAINDDKQVFHHVELEGPVGQWNSQVLEWLAWGKS